MVFPTISQTPVVVWMCADPRLQPVLKEFGCALKKGGRTSGQIRIEHPAGGAIEVLNFYEYFRRQIMTLSSRGFGAFGFFLHDDCHHSVTHGILPNDADAFRKKRVSLTIATAQEDFPDLYFFGGDMRTEKAFSGIESIDMLCEEYWDIIGP